VSSFELLQSGIVDGLLRFATDPERSGKILLVQDCSFIDVVPVSLKRRQELLLDAFTTRRQKGGYPQTPLAFFVKKLQESLTRMESFEVVTVAQGIDGRS
jgi:E3 ubiquitin-protein ligase TRIP12